VECLCITRHQQPRDVAVALHPKRSIKLVQTPCGPCLCRMPVCLIHNTLIESATMHAVLQVQGRELVSRRTAKGSHQAPSALPGCTCQHSCPHDRQQAEYAKCKASVGMVACLSPPPGPGAQRACRFIVFLARL
jgi:hypothetical protein